MTLASDESPYAVLELPRTASANDIESAYRRLSHLLAEGSLAAYGMLDGEEVNRLRHQLEAAYALLSDETRRQQYDRSPQDLASQPASTTPHLPSTRPIAQRRRLHVPQDVALSEEAEVDGAVLRAMRERAGASLEEFCDWTKISRRYLTALEENDVARLPASVYVRGFVAEYARLLGLDGVNVARRYLKRLS